MWNGKVTGSRDKGGGFQVLGVNSPEQRRMWKRHEEACESRFECRRRRQSMAKRRFPSSLASHRVQLNPSLRNGKWHLSKSA